MILFVGGMKVLKTQGNVTERYSHGSTWSTAPEGLEPGMPSPFTAKAELDSSLVEPSPSSAATYPNQSGRNDHRHVLKRPRARGVTAQRFAQNRFITGTRSIKFHVVYEYCKLNANDSSFVYYGILTRRTTMIPLSTPGVDVPTISLCHYFWNGRARLSSDASR